MKIDEKCHCESAHTRTDTCTNASFNTVSLSVRPSVTRLLRDETKEHTADILIPHERVITTEIGAWQDSDKSHPIINNSTG